ncbi:MAG: caspase family protein [Candidatus Marinimicrobia bacterium]|jgi:WD40 repeat protein|nr:caspase family protein [Candidatus Neomarinimicrobiota bacterium]
MKKLLILILLLFSSFVFATDMNDFKLVKTLNDHSSPVRSVSFSSDCIYLASGSSDNTVKIYDTDNWQLIKTLSDHSKGVNSVSFSSDGRYLASGSWDNTVKIYDTNNWQLIKTLKDHSNSVLSVSFSSDGKYFASGSRDNNVKIYFTSNWQLIKTLRDHSNSVNSVSFSSDGRYLASGSSDKTVKIYGTDNWQLIKTLRDHSMWVGFVNSVSFSSDCIYLASGSSDKTVKIYSVSLMVKVDKVDVFIKSYVENHINEWQKKGEFEKTIEYKERMSNREKKAGEFFNEAKEIYIDKLLSIVKKGNIKILGNYDADRETYKLNISTIGDVVVNVPIDHAKSFKENENKLKLQNPKIVRKSDEYALSSIGVYDPIANKEFVYDTNIKEDYNPLAEMNFEFKPYNYNFDKVEIESQIVQNKPKKKEKQEDRYDLYKNIPKNTHKNRDAVAVIIGNKDYKKINDVDFAINDARLMKKYLMDSFGYSEKNILYLENASQGDFIGIFGNKDNYKGKLYNYVKSGKSDVFIYYSGHGAPNVDTKKGYFVPVDCNPSTVELNGYSLEVFYDNLNKIEFRKLTVVIDACFSGENTLKNVSPIFIQVENPMKFKDNTFIYTSAKGNQLSTWFPNKEHSLFTYYFLKGIQEKGIEVTNSQVTEFLNENVEYMARRLHNREQKPTFNGDKSKYLVK